MSEISIWTIWNISHQTLPRPDILSYVFDIDFIALMLVVCQQLSNICLLLFHLWEISETKLIFKSESQVFICQICLEHNILTCINSMIMWNHAIMKGSFSCGLWWYCSRSAQFLEIKINLSTWVQKINWLNKYETLIVQVCHFKSDWSCTWSSLHLPSLSIVLHFGL